MDRLVWGTALFLVLALCEAVEAQQPSCDPALEAVRSSYGYRARAFRCEGLYVSRASAGALYLLSLHAGTITYELVPGEQLSVTVPNTSALGPGLVHIRGVGIRRRTYYRMDAVIESGGTLSWPVEDVLRPARLSADRIGMFGWVETPTSDTLFVPIRASSASSELPDTVTLIVRADFDAAEMNWRATSESGVPSPWTSVDRRLPAGTPVRILLPWVTVGRQYVEVMARQESRATWERLNITVFRGQ